MPAPITITLRLPEPLRTNLRAMCARRGWPLATFVRYALESTTEEAFAKHLAGDHAEQVAGDARLAERVRKGHQ